MQSRGAGGALVLNGEALTLREIRLDGQEITTDRYSLNDDKLVLFGADSTALPATFLLETVVGKWGTDHDYLVKSTPPRRWSSTREPKGLIRVF